MTGIEQQKLTHLIKELGATSGKVCKVNGEWFIIPRKKPQVPAPIINLPPAQWGDGNNVTVIEGMR